MTTLIPKTTPHFCHEWKRTSHWEAIISSSPEELASSSSSSTSSMELSSSSSSSEAYGDGEGEATKPQRWAWRCAIRPPRVFTRYNSVVRVPRRASICSSYAMITSSVTSPAKEGVEVDGGVAVSVHGRFGRSWTLLHRTVPMSMACIMGKWSDSG